MLTAEFWFHMYLFLSDEVSPHLAVNQSSGAVPFFPWIKPISPSNVCHPHEEAASESHYRISFTAADVSTSLVASIHTKHHKGHDTRAQVRRAQPSDRRGISTVVLMHVTFMRLNCPVALIWSSSLISSGEKAKRVLKDTGSETERTEPASVTVSSVRPGCILMETEYSPYRSEERKWCVMVYKAGTSETVSLWLRSLRDGCRTLGYDDITSF